MAEMATLQIRVNAKGVKKATDDLEKLGLKAKVVDGNNDKLTRSFSKLGTAIGALSVGYATLEFAKFADTTTRLNNLLKVSIEEGQNLDDTFSNLTQLAIETNSQLESTVRLYSKLSSTTKELGLSQQELYTITTAVNQSFAISGSDTTEAASAIKQLSQALASGAFRGDEFNSVAENAPRLMNALANSLGVTIGKLREMAADGKLTSEVLAKGLLGEAGKIDSEFKTLNKTVSQGFENLTTGVTSLIGVINKGTGATTKFANLLDFLGKKANETGKNLSNFQDEQYWINRQRAMEEIVKTQERINRLTEAGVAKSVIDGELERIKQIRNALGVFELNLPDLPSEIAKNANPLEFKYVLLPEVTSTPPTIQVEKELDQAKNLIEGYDWSLTNGGDLSDGVIFPELKLFNIEQFNNDLLAIKTPLEQFQYDLEQNLMSTGEIMRETFYNFSQDAGDAIASVIVDGENMSEALKSVARSAIKQTISGLVQIGIQETVLSGIRAANKGVEAAASITAATATAAAWSPAAAAVTVATGGTNLTAAQAQMPAFLTSYSGLMATMSAPIGRASGGDLSAGSSSYVAENGMEIFMPNQNGRVFNKDDVKSMISGNSGSSNITLNVTGGTNFEQWYDNGGRDKIIRDIAYAQEF